MSVRAEESAGGAGRARQHLVTDEDAGQRLDNLLGRLLKGLPKTRVYRLIRRGEVRVNGGRVGPDYRTRGGDRIRIPPVSGLGAGSAAPIPDTLQARLRERILHEDDDVLVIDKPAGVAVHGGSGLAWGLIDALRAARPDCRFLELVHRLDRDTSGCLLVARRRSSLRHYHAELREGRVGKRYLTLLAGRLPRGSTAVEAALDDEARQGGERTVRVDAAGKAARSVFRRLDVLGRDWSLAEVSIDTGRTHQIRVHAAHLGTPVAGDPRYGDPQANATIHALGLRRVFLHASELAVRDPTGRPQHYCAPLPAELATVVARLKSTVTRGDLDG
jgi:23S rRNA pseudouridine955/2504/2580 synthase